VDRTREMILVLKSVSVGLRQSQKTRSRFSGRVSIAYSGLGVDDISCQGGLYPEGKVDTLLHHSMYTNRCDCKGRTACSS